MHTCVYKRKWERERERGRGGEREGGEREREGEREGERERGGREGVVNSYISSCVLFPLLSRVSWSPDPERVVAGFVARESEVTVETSKFGVTRELSA